MDGEVPAKRVRLTPPRNQGGSLNTNDDFVAFDLGDDSQAPRNSPTEPQEHYRRREDPRERHDKPKSRHVLPNTDAWILVKTKLGRRFVHNVETKQSFWRIPRQLQAAVDEFDFEEEKKHNLEWSETQLSAMRQGQATTSTKSDRKRRSVSLQREDEEAMMAELAAQAERAEEQDAKNALEAVSTLQPRGYIGDASDSEYEYVEVTDTEGEGGEESEEEIEEPPEAPVQQDGPVDFGEDDIAYQLAMMGEEYGLDPEEYQQDEDENRDEDDEGLAITEEEAIALFHQMLDEHGISPFIPWDKLISDAGPDSIAFDERYTILRSSKARKDAFDSWSRDRAAQVNQQRANEEKKDARIPYLQFLATNASTKLYWPEFKRKFKREPEMNERTLHDKDREKLYRDLVVKLKLPESKRKEELQGLLRTIPADKPRSIPEKILTNVVFYALPLDIRNEMLKAMSIDLL